MFKPSNLFLKNILMKRKIKPKKIPSKRQRLASKSLLFDIKNNELLQEEDKDEGFSFSLKCSASSESHGVQPLGNLYFSSNSHNSRNSGLGNMQILSDELVLEILGLLEGTLLGVLSSVSKSLYVFCNHEPLWRNLVLEMCKDGIFYTKSWKNTYVRGFKGDSFEGFRSGLKVRDFYSDYLFQSWLCANMEMKSEWIERDNILRRKGISVEEFVLEFEEPNKPVLLEGCLDNWTAMQKWDREFLTELCGGEKFAVGPVEMNLEDFFRYSDQAAEERPLYLFDPKFADKVPQLGLDYRVPEYFDEDLFSVLGTERPDYRWIIIGPAGSGSSFHIDPNSTSAWNAVIKGSKKWVLFPPDIVPPGVHPSPDGSEVASPVSIMEWFMNFYDATKSFTKRPIECVCKAGEVIFVPSGWWHLVINLEDSIAITQNYVSRLLLPLKQILSYGDFT
ncbi:hypothetical protein Leryth_008817 [Lithospermum erythrorhizon]|nr:hypothetical protein Leryth_008817 [Lithospermum erythrorhizon]